MNARQKIKELLYEKYERGVVNAMQIWKGYSASTQENGWHYLKFGESKAHYLGKSVEEARQNLSAD